MERKGVCEDIVMCEESEIKLKWGWIQKARAGRANIWYDVTPPCLPQPLPNSIPKHTQKPQQSFMKSLHGASQSSATLSLGNHYHLNTVVTWRCPLRWNRIIILILGHQRWFGMEKTESLFKTVLL